MRADEYLALDALGLAERLRKKEVSPAEVLAAAEARCDAVNPKINAVIHRFAATAIGELPAEPSAAPFWGVPFLVKDLDGTLANAQDLGPFATTRPRPIPTCFVATRRSDSRSLGRRTRRNSGLSRLQNRNCLARRKTPGISSIRRAVQAVARRPRSRRGSCRWPTRGMAADRFVFRRRPAGSLG
jgi:hypothetical protein